jgi:hypothetical protein
MRPHKQWLNVACAALGIQRSVALNVKKKAARGYIQEDYHTSIRNASNVALSDSVSTNRSSRREGTGVIHFVSNKIRLLGQSLSLDGPHPKCLIVPVMTLNDARNWRGEGYKAVCFAGVPKGSPLDVDNSGDVYKTIGLSDLALRSVEYTRDAEQDEVNLARTFLAKAVCALLDMIAGLSEEELDYATTSDDTLRQAHKEAQDMICKVPSPLPTNESGEKPACLVTFGNLNETNMHPAPDPLLLALRAANIFGIMAGMKMLASAEPDDSDESVGDIIEEEAYLEAREQSLRSKSWDDLARGLGQPNGYIVSFESSDSF